MSQSASGSEGSAPHPALRIVHPVRRIPRRFVVAGTLIIAMTLAVATMMQVRSTPRSVPTPAVTAPEARLTARGRIVPVQQARVGTLSGGVVTRLTVPIGEDVREQQEIARIRNGDATEVLTAPLRGTLTDILVHLGDTVTPGTVVASVADLTRLQVETTDLDEFLVGQVGRGQLVMVAVDAVEGLTLAGYVRSISLEPRTMPNGDEHYPSVIDIGPAQPSLRAGMSVRVDFTRQP